MAALDTTRPIAAARGVSEPSVFTRIIGSIAEWNDRRMTRKALMHLTARELDDIGLTFADLDRL